MLKKVVAVLLLISLCCSVFALDMSKAVPYKENEFPKFTYDLRRAEIIFFGSLPLAFPAASLGLSAFKVETDFWKTMGVACGIAGAIVLTDFIIGLIQAD